MSIDATVARRLLNMIETHYGARAAMLVLVGPDGDAFVLERADDAEALELVRFRARLAAAAPE